MTFPSYDLFPSEVAFPSATATSDDGAVVTLAGLDLTSTDGFGVTWSTIVPISGWDGSPASSLELTQRTRAPGGWPGPREMASRHLSLTGFLDAPDADTAEDAMDRLNAGVSLNGSILTVQRGTRVRSVIAYRQGEVSFDEITDTLFQWGVDLVCPDPRKFTEALTASTGLPSSTGGLTIPHTVPWLINSTVVSGRCFLTNPGNANGPVVLRIDGPIIGPTVTHVGSGATLTFASSLTLAAGEFLTVDMEQQIALANGQASRNAWISSRGWFALEPGQNEFAFSAVSGSGLLTVTATPAWQ